MPQTILTKTYDINTLVLNPQKRLGLFGLLNILQDIAWQHAEHLGCGFAQMFENGTIWVLTRQKLEMTDWPVWGDTVTIRTWARPFMSARAPRDFEVLIGARRLGQATTNWLILDATTRRPKRFDVLEHPVACREDGVLTLEPKKIPVRDGLETVAVFHVCYSDLDVNGHVNNTRYAQWVLDSFALAALQNSRITGYEINFLAETNVGDEVTLERTTVAADDATIYHFQGRKTSDGKVAFTARLSLAK